MAKLATCPGCTTQLALPEEATLSDRARCPRCHEEFLLMETVQFSIPTAEILVQTDPQTISPSDTVTPTTYTPSVDPYAPAGDGYESPASDFDPPSQPIESVANPQPPSEPFPASATLSDWEARLKRAMAADVDDHPLSKPTFDFSSAAPEVNTPEPVTYEPQDFSVDDADLAPALPAADADWSAQGFYREDDEHTVKLAGDQPVSDHSLRSGLEGDADRPPAIRTDSVATRKQRKRSPLRTLVSASLGVVGIPLGLYALLWLRGPVGDMLGIAQYLPSFMLPSDFQGPDFEGSSGLLVEKSEHNVPDTSGPTSPEQAVASAPGESEENFAEEIADAEPLVREDPAVAPASAELPGYQGPTFGSVDSAEFGELLSAAQQAAAQLGEGDLKSKESVASKGHAYMVLARLADKLSFLSQSLSTPADFASAKAAKQLVETTLRDERVQRDVPQIALRWWQYADRPSPGILLVGQIKRLQATEAGTIAYVSLGTDPITPDIPVLMGRANARDGDVIGIAGTIESAPARRMPAIDSELGPIVIAHMSFPLDANTSESDTKL